MSKDHAQVVDGSERKKRLTDSKKRLMDPKKRLVDIMSRPQHTLDREGKKGILNCRTNVPWVQSAQLKCAY